MGWLATFQPAARTPGRSQRHRAVGVPLYVVYPRGGGDGRILPTLLTAGMVEDALREAAR